MKMKVGDLRCGLPEFVAGKSDMKMKVGDLRCGLPEFVAGKSDMTMKKIPKAIDLYKMIKNHQSFDKQ